jgi:hypothetical protein
MTTTGRLHVALALLAFLLLTSTIGCSHAPYWHQESLAQRIVPPVNLDVREELPTPKKMTEETSGESPAHSGQPKAGDDTDPREVKQPTAAQGTGIAREPALALTLAEAIDTAFRQQPRQA